MNKRENTADKTASFLAREGYSESEVKKLRDRIVEIFKKIVDGADVRFGKSSNTKNAAGAAFYALFFSCSSAEGKGRRLRSSMPFMCAMATP